MAEGGMSPEAVARHNRDVVRQKTGVFQQVLREEIGTHDFRPGDTKLTPADQAAFNANLRLKLAREDAQKPKS